MAKVKIKDNTSAVKKKLLAEINLAIKETANESVNIIKGRFESGKDVNGVPFAARKNKDEGRAILVKRGKLRNSIRYSKHVYSGKNKAIAFELFAGDNSKINYAKIHNEGGTIPITSKMRAFFWAMFAKTKQPIYKALALKRTPIVIPKREFFGLSESEKSLLEKMIKEKLENLKF